MADFQKLGLDRIAQNISKAVTKPVGGLVTGDITKGSVVTVTVTDGEGTATVSAQRTGAIPILSQMAAPPANSMQWTIDSTILSVDFNDAAQSGTVTFWVF